jgi:hypothetical protein
MAAIPIAPPRSLVPLVAHPPRFWQRAREKFHRRAACATSIFLMLVVLVVITTPVQAAPPENANPALAPWFQSLEVPGTNHSSCCSQSDCRPVDYRISGDYYEALLTPEQFSRAGVLQPRWIPVPFDRILQRVDNPTGKAILCWLPGMGVLCFVRPDDT